MLEALINKQKQQIHSKSVVIEIPVSLIRPNPYQPRKVFNRFALEELCESIRSYGILQPITVRRMADMFYELVAGERRLRAAKIVGMRAIPAIVVDIGENDSAILALVENSQREDLHFLEEAEAYYNLLKMHSITQEELSKRIGKSQSTISNKIRLLRLPLLIRDIIKEKGMTERQARAISKLPDEEIQTKILKIVCEKGLNTSKTEELIESAIEKIMQVKKGKRVLISAYKDLRIFVNSIKKVVSMMQRAGLNAQASQTDKGEYFEFNIRVQKT